MTAQEKQLLQKVTGKNASVWVPVFLHFPYLNLIDVHSSEKMLIAMMV
jgi:hypothetical protein